MKSIRNQIVHQQRRKATKRPRVSLNDSSSFLIQQGENENTEQIEPAEVTASDDDETENRPLVTFQRGTTNMGGLCIWNQGFRFTRIRGPWFRCSNRDCDATAALTGDGGEGVINGVLGAKGHNHLPDPAKYQAELKRNRIKATTRDNPRQKPSKLLAGVRAGTNDETYVSMGTDRALEGVMKRQKQKVFGNVDRVDPLNVVLPDALLVKEGESTLLYDSRVHRPGEPDVVLVFAHPKLLDVLKKARKFSVDGTFKAAPSAWTQSFVIGAFVNRRLVLCAHALLPGKQIKFYAEALNAVKAAIAPNAPARIISDFETAMIRAMSVTFPMAKLTGCLFHLSQALFRKWREMGLEQLYGNETEKGEAARNSFRKLLALALVPEQHVRRGFALVVSHATDGLAPFFGYFARVYVGQTAFEQEAGANAFGPDADQSRSSIYSNTFDGSAGHSQNSSFVSVNLDHPYAHDFTPFGASSRAPSVRSPALSTFTVLSSTTVSVVPRWELPIVRPPRYPLQFWNVHDRARSSLEKTNNAMEATHLQFSRGLVHHPSLSDFLAAILDDVDKQTDVARSARLLPHTRRIKYILKEQLIGDALDDAEYNTDEDIMNVLSLLSLQMQGYVGGLRARGTQNVNEEPDD